MESAFEAWATPILIGGLILFMCFIILELARKSKAGKFGTIMLFIVLGAGMLGFIIKTVITEMMESGGL
jgi:ABC-type lipoprotein release transport system permease subunit